MESSCYDIELLDQLLEQVERGQPHMAAHQLVGMLDIAVRSEADVRYWRTAIAAHALGECVGMESGTQNCCAESDQPTPLRAALDRLDYHAALKMRERLSLEAISHAKAVGHTVLLADQASHDIATGMLAHTGRSGQHAGGFAAILSETAAKENTRYAAPEQYVLSSGHARYDLVVAVGSAGHISPGDLTPMIGALASRLADGARLLISCFLPNHMGRGWRRLQPGAEPYAHREPALIAAATANGLELRHFRDAANCMVWCQFTRSANFSA